MPLDLSAIAADQSAPTEDKLTVIRDRVAALRDMRAERLDVEEHLALLNRAITEMETQTLPDLMAEAHVNRIGLPAAGNLPAVEVESAPYYAASIPNSWPLPQRAAAYAWLQDHGHGDLIKTEVTISFPRDERDNAIHLRRSLAEQGFAPQVKEAVHHATLTAWLKEQVEQHNSIPPLEIIGGRIGRIARIKEIEK